MRKNSGSSLFLMELILAILIFSLSSTVCIRLFVNAHLISKDSQNINRGILETQNMAEIYLSPEGSLEKVEELFPGEAVRQGNSVSLYFDDEWNILGSGSVLGASYVVTLKLIGENGSLQKAISTAGMAGKDQGTIFEIPLSKYVGGSR